MDRCDRSPDDFSDDGSERDFQIGMDDAREENREYALLQRQPDYFGDMVRLNREIFTPEMFIDDDKGIAA
jgi:hypothetical protein